MGKFAISYNLVRLSFKIIMKEKELFVYAILSFVCSLIILLAVVWWGFFYISAAENMTRDQQWVVFIICMFCVYLLSYFIVFFFNTSIIGSVNRIINWKENKFGDGIKDSMDHLGKIIQWTFLATTVSMILKLLESNKYLGRIVSSILGTAWSILTFFSFPIMILKGYWPIQAVKESWSLFKKTWGERAIIYVSTWLFFFMIFLLVLALSTFIILSGKMVLGAGIFLLLIIFIMITNSLSNTIINVVLLQYVQTWALPDIVPNKEVFNYVITKK